MIDVPTCQQCGSILVCVCCPPGIMREIEGLRAGAARMAKEVADLTRERDEARTDARGEAQEYVRCGNEVLAEERDQARADADAWRKRFIAENENLDRVIADHSARLAEVAAQAAQMHEALNDAKAVLDDEKEHGVDHFVARHRVDDALSLDAGRAYAAEHEALQRLVSNLETWTHEMGAALIPLGADTFGEGVRVTKDAVAAKILNAMSLASLLDEVRRG